MSRGAFKLRDTDDETYYKGYKAALFNSLPGGIAFGAYIVVYITSVYIHLSKPGFTSSPIRMSLCGITTFMFILGIIGLVLSSTCAIRKPNADSSTAHFTCYSLLEITFYLMCIMCDSICAWRTVIIWNKNKRVIAILVFSILVSAAIAMCGVFIQGSLLFGYFYVVVFAGPIFVTNMLSTGLITWKAWQRRTSVMGHLHEGSGSLRLERVFALLIESGFIYCCIWIIYAILMVIDSWADQGFTSMMFISGIYPTLVIILISNQMSPVERYSTLSTHLTEMQDMVLPALGRDGSIP